MSVEIDSNDPVGSLVKAGVTHDKSDTSSSSSFAIAGVPVGGTTTVGERHVWKLPSESKLEVVFGPEKLSKKIVKIFKKELQVGDPAFDSLVYIDTADKDVTQRFMAAKGRRGIVSGFIAEGGRVAVDKEQVVFEVSGVATEDQLMQMAWFVADVMAF